MKRLCTLLFCCCLLAAVPFVNAEPARSEKSNDFSAFKPGPIVRSAKNPLVLTLMGRPYFLTQSEPDNSDSDVWQNFYLPKGSTYSPDEAQEAILIQKTDDTTCEEQLKDIQTDKVLSLDTRLRDDQMASGEVTEDEETHYVVIRSLQEGTDVFTLMIVYPRTTQSDEQWQQVQRNIYSSVRKTAKGVIVQNFIESVCKFGSDCRAD